MRVIGGEFRSRALKSRPGLDTRPTPDRLRESLFNILTPRIAGATFADLYAGTGAVGIEALSRGAAHAIFVELNRAAARVIEENLQTLGIAGRAQVRVQCVTAAIVKLEAKIVFLDPPYSMEEEYGRALALLGGGNGPALAIAQHSTRLRLEPHYGKLRQARVVRQGDNALTFYET